MSVVYNNASQIYAFSFKLQSIALLISDYMGDFDKSIFSIGTVCNTTHYKIMFYYKKQKREKQNTSLFFVDPTESIKTPGF